MGEPAPSREDKSVIWFEEGIIGVPGARRFQLVEREDSPIRVLRCLDIDGFALPVSDPRLADPGYAPDLGSRIADILELDEKEPVLLLAVTTLSSDGPVANLRAPLVVNPKRRAGAQIILEDRSYPLRAPVTTGE